MSIEAHSIAFALFEHALNYDFIWEWQSDPFYLHFSDCLGVSFLDSTHFNHDDCEHLQITIDDQWRFERAAQNKAI